ncbi:MBL fold metallo-hydrolase [Lucifera butyrica]|nr:MBL fold metallo-hydrolase [Lucifera butyrica]
MLNAPMSIYPVLIWDDKEATLIDTGFPGQFEQLRQSIEEAGASWEKIKHIIITHQDWDHIGTIPDILTARDGKVTIYAHIQEKPYLEGKIPYIKMTPERIASRLASLPATIRPQAAALFAKIPTFQVNRTLQDRETIPLHGGLEIIHTPGHTPGHICILVKSLSLLIAGDQLRIEKGTLVGPAPEFTPDMPAALQSMKKLADHPIDQVICYHGGWFGPNASCRIKEIAQEKR